MDLTKISPQKREILRRIERCEREGLFDQDVEDDPESKELLPDDVDYLAKKLSTRLKTRTANFLGDRYFLNLINKRLKSQKIFKSIRKDLLFCLNNRKYEVISDLIKSIF